MDFETVERFLNDGDLFDNFEWNSQLGDFLDRSPRLTDSHGVLKLAVVLKAGELIGCAAFFYTDPHQEQAAFVLLIDKDFRRRGLGLEVVECLFTFGFNTLSLHRIAAWCCGKNVPARRLLAKAGMRLEGEFIKSQKVDGVWMDTFYYAVLKEERRFSLPPA